MEGAHFEVPKLVGLSSPFPPRRRSHLKSETYRTLVRILSHCHENAEVSLSLATEIHPQELRAACCNHLKQATEEPSCDQVGGDFRSTESVDPAINEAVPNKDISGMNNVEDGDFHDNRVKVDDIENMMKKGDGNNDQNTLGDISQYNHYVQEENYANEIGHSITRYNMLDHVNNYNTNSLDHQNSVNLKISPKELQDENLHCPTAIAEEVEHIAQKLSGAISSLNGNRADAVSKPKEDNQENRLVVVSQGTDQLPLSLPQVLQSGVIACGHEGSNIPSFRGTSYGDCEQDKDSIDKSTSMVVDVSKVEHATLCKDTQMDRLPSIHETMISPNFITENEEVEEGEIFGDYGVCDISSSTNLEPTMALSDRVVDFQISEVTRNKNKQHSIQADKKENNPASFPVSFVEHSSNVNREEFKQNKSRMEDCEHKLVISEKMTSMKEDQTDFLFEQREYGIKNSETKKNVGSFAGCVNNQVMLDEVSNEYDTGCKEVASMEKETGVCNKKKRGPLSEGRKRKKKMKERKKRAETNRKLGVKRLKLHPITVPKPVVYCRHYLKGRCQEGEKCKFSHDTIPLTKSTPCTYFARHSCMKGDDCPFDHQLSKYPCSNFVTKGSCIRGEACMFSHKVLQKEESTSTPNLKTESKTPQILDNLNSQKKLNSIGILQKTAPVPNNNRTLCVNTPQSETLPRKTTGLPSGVNFLFSGASAVYQEKKDIVNARNVLKIPPEAAPKGINFLSFGKTAPNDSSIKKLATSLSFSDAMKPSQLDSSSLCTQVSSSPFVANVTSDNQMKVMLKADQKPNELLNKAEIAMPKQTNFLSTKAFVGNYVPDASLSSSSFWKAGSDLSVQNKKEVDSKHENSSSLLSRLPSNPISSGQSAGILASSMRTGKPNSARNALFSTLAFAEKYEASINKNKSSGSAALSIDASIDASIKGRNENISKFNGSTAVSNEGNMGDGNQNDSKSLKNDQAKASKILEFLLGKC